ncbi:MAG TPA: MalY/PatB family protein [Haloplasmataceae bacterium]
MNFAKVINRKNTNSVKWDYFQEDLLPLWVADMDFRSPKEVIKALDKRVKHGIFGYTFPQESYYEAVINWMKKRHNWQIKKDWIIRTPGIVTALNMIVQVFTKENDSVLIQRPVYTPFSEAIINNNRKLVNSPLILNNNHYEIDFDDFENKIINEKVKLFIMCSPHNPVGRVWTKDELIKMGNICLKHNVLMVVDEIHHDIVFKKYEHLPFASLSEEFSLNCITCTAPSKTFNIAGLKISNIIIENEYLRKQFNDYLEKISLQSSNLLALTACEAAYNFGAKWLDELINYIYENKKFVVKFINDNLPMIKVIDSEATYLLWLDFRSLGMDNDKLSEFINKEAKLLLNNGYEYGEEGSGFLRLNIGCPRSILEEALIRLDNAIKKHFH